MRGSSFIILFRDAASRCIDFVSDENGDLAVFADKAQAERAASKVRVCRAYPYRIVKVDDL